MRLVVPSRNFTAMRAAGTCVMCICEGTQDLTRVTGHEGSRICQGRTYYVCNGIQNEYSTPLEHFMGSSAN